MVSINHNNGVGNVGNADVHENLPDYMVPGGRPPTPSGGASPLLGRLAGIAHGSAEDARANLAHPQPRSQFGYTGNQRRPSSGPTWANRLEATVTPPPSPQFRASGARPGSQQTRRTFVETSNPDALPVANENGWTMPVYRRPQSPPPAYSHTPPPQSFSRPSSPPPPYPHADNGGTNAQTRIRFTRTSNPDALPVADENGWTMPVYQRPQSTPLPQTAHPAPPAYSEVGAPPPPYPHGDTKVSTPEKQKISFTTSKLSGKFDSAIRSIKGAFKRDTTPRDTRMTVGGYSRGAGSERDLSITWSVQDIVKYIEEGGRPTAFAYLANRQAQHRKLADRADYRSPVTVKGRFESFSELDLNTMHLSADIDDIFNRIAQQRAR